MSINLREHFRKEFVDKFGEIPENDSDLRLYLENLINKEFEIRSDLNWEIRSLNRDNEELRSNLEKGTSAREDELKQQVQKYRDAYSAVLGKIYNIIDEIPRDI